MLTLYKNIKKFREEKGMSQETLAKLTGYTDRSSIAKIEKGLVDLQQSKIELFAKALNTTVRALVGWDDEEEEQKVTYYLNEETAQAAQEIFENKELRALFDATRDADPEDLRALHNMALALKRKERGNEDDTGC